MGSTFFPGFAAPQVAGLIQQHTGSQIRDIQAVSEVHERMRRMKWNQASLVSLHPWAQFASGYLQHDLKLPGAPALEDTSAPRIRTMAGRDVMYVQHVYTHYLTPTRPTESGDHTATELLPIELACDFISQHSGMNEEGGFFCYESSEPAFQIIDSGQDIALIPSQTISNVADVPRLTIREAFETCHERQIQAYMKRVEKATSAWDAADKLARKGISSNDRKAGKLLHAWGILEKLPPWALVTRDIRSAPLQGCPLCSHEAQPSAVKCTNGNCSHIFDPFKAFQDGLIDFDTPGAITALRRLSKTQLEELEIYPAVLPLDEYKKELVKKASKKEGK